MKGHTVSLEGKMMLRSYLSFAVGLLLLYSLNGVSLNEVSPMTESDDKVKPHYGCNTTENWSAMCGKELITITKQIKKFLVHRHNTFRDAMASGAPLHLPAAGRMLKLSWDPDLADAAKFLVMRCDIRLENRCISTLHFSASSLNEAYNKSKKKENPYRIVGSQLNAWYDQYKKITLQNILDGSLLNNSAVGHFLRMMVGPSNGLGCAMAAKEIDGWNYQWLTCLYSCSPPNKTLLYEFAPKPGEFCTKGVDHKFQHLCSDQEVVDSCTLSPLFRISNGTASQTRTSTKPRKQRRAPFTVGYMAPGIILIRNVPPYSILVYITYWQIYALCTPDAYLVSMTCVQSYDYGGYPG